MIDYLSIEIVNTDKEVFYSNQELIFTHKTERQSEVILCNEYGYYTDTALYENLTIEIQRNIQNENYIIKIKGSLQKFHQSGNNIDDFSITEIQNSITNLTEKLCINPNNCLIHQIEFGLNCELDFSTSKIIGNILTHKGKTFELKKFNNQGLLKKFIHSQYDIKIYDKGLQYKVTENKVRFEIKVKKMQFLNKKKIFIKNINSLKNKETLLSLSKILISFAKDIIFTNDELLEYNFSDEYEKNIYLKFSNSQSLIFYKSNSNRKTYNEHRRKFEQIISKYSEIDYKSIFIKNIKYKTENLLSEVTNLPVSKTEDKLHIYPIVVSNNPIQRKYCLTCGRDITLQKMNSQFCSESIFGRGVKKCRNTVSNFKKREKYYYPNQTLFDIDNILNPHYKRIKDIAFKH